MDITKLSLTELKALCYDQIVLLNQTQANVTLLQNEIAKKEKENDNLSKNPDTSKDIQ